MEETNIVAIEIGSSKIKGALGSYSPTGVLTVKAVEEEPLTDWVRYGAVSNVEETSRLVNRIIRKIENRVAPRKISEVWVALGGRSCHSERRDVDFSLPEEQEITDAMLKRLQKEAAATPMTDRDLLAVIPRQYVVDKSVVAHPKGTVGRNIRFSANLITCRLPSKRNIDILFADKLKLNVGGYEVRQLALGDLVLTTEEKRLGCMLVDFGAETTAVSIYKHGYLQYMATLPIGSRNITRDLTALNYLEEKAEEIKRQYGNAAATVTSTQQINGIDMSMVNNYVSHRAGEIIANIREQIKIAGFKTSDLSAGIIIVGRGSRLTGFTDRLATSTTMKLRTGAITSPDIRIADSRISTSDEADVIAVLYKSAIHGARECLTSPILDTPAEDEETIVLGPDESADIIEEIPEPTPEPVKPPKKGGGIFGKLKQRFGELINENDEDDDDDELNDDVE